MFVPRVRISIICSCIDSYISFFKSTNERGNGAQNMWPSKPEGKKDFSHS